MHGIYMAYYLDLIINQRHKEKNLDFLISELKNILDNQSDFKVKTIQKKIHQDLDVFMSILKKDKKNVNDEFVLIALSPIHPYVFKSDRADLRNNLNKIYNEINKNR